MERKAEKVIGFVCLVIFVISIVFYKYMAVANVFQEWYYGALNWIIIFCSAKAWVKLGY